MTSEKTSALTGQMFVGKVISLLFNRLSRLVIAFHLSSKHLLISWLQSPSAVILEPTKNSLPSFPLFLHLLAMKCKVSLHFHCFSTYLPWSEGTGCHYLSFFNVKSFKPAFSLSSFINRLFSSALSAITVVSSAYLRIFLLETLIPACASSSPAFGMMYAA